jgi:hypothetical protein
MVAPLTPHIAVSLWLTGQVGFEMLKLRFRWWRSHPSYCVMRGKPEAYRYVLRQRRSLTTRSK